MYDLSNIIAQTSNVISAALDVIDPSTPIGALVMVAFGIIIIMMVLRKLKGILPRG